MGDRVSVSLIQDGAEPGSWQESVVVCAHWGGSQFPERVRVFLKDWRSRVPKASISTPETRMDPWYMVARVIAEFVDEVSVGRTLKDVDNSDNGHFRIYVPSLKMTGPHWREGESPEETTKKIKEIEGGG